jgi:ribonuclease HI
MSKFYAVRVGRVPGIYKTWPECQEQIKGFSNAQYKSFLSLSEAENFINNDNKQVLETSPNDICVYVDGSYRDGCYTWAYAVYKNDIEIHSSCGVGPNNGAEAMRNVAGEILAIIKAVQWAKDNDLKVIIHYDYQGLAAWADGSWEAKNKYTQFYAKFIQSHIKYVSFKKVKAHSNIKGNERVDQLAKSALI